MGYEHRPFVSGLTKKELKEQELYVKGPESKRTHYVHVTVYNSDYWKKDLLFRDYLIKNPTRARKYAELKKKLAKDYATNREAYTDNKDKFIKEILEMTRKNNSTKL
ncbi:MAG: hypothetical protein GF370_03830 [Candidatus Nealsonbacteria bacterium]|nr:hypothetical protein [Candidatus Nealsonbacteria bacterium]